MTWWAPLLSAEWGFPESGWGVVLTDQVQKQNGKASHLVLTRNQILQICNNNASLFTVFIFGFGKYIFHKNIIYANIYSFALISNTVIIDRY